MLCDCDDDEVLDVLAAVCESCCKADNDKFDRFGVCLGCITAGVDTADDVVDLGDDDVPKRDISDDDGAWNVDEDDDVDGEEGEDEEEEEELLAKLSPGSPRFL